MTCIVGMVDGNRIVMGGDSAGSNGWTLVQRSDSKVFKVGEFLIGYTTSFRMGQILRYRLKPPVPEENQDLHEYMATNFIDAVRDCLKAGGFARKDSEVESGGNFLVGFRGRLFEVDNDYQVGESICGYNAVGCGENFALGSMFTSEGMAADKRIRIALNAAEQFSTGVRGPFQVLST